MDRYRYRYTIDVHKHMQGYMELSTTKDKRQSLTFTTESSTPESRVILDLPPVLLKIC